MKSLMQILLYYLLFSRILSQTPNNIYSDDKHLIVLKPPSVDDSYYKAYFTQLVEFYVNYVNTVKGKDNKKINDFFDSYFQERNRKIRDLLVKANEIEENDNNNQLFGMMKQRIPFSRDNQIDGGTIV